MKKIYLSYFVLMLSLSLIFGNETYATKYSIDVRSFEFSPSDITTVTIGDTIRWEWKNGSHTTTSTSIPGGAPAWDNLLDASHLTYDYIPSVAGVYHYKCTPHESMGMVGQFTVLSSVGIQKNTSVPKITIFPNPVRDRIFFNYVPQERVFIQRLNIYSVGGKLIREVSFNDWSMFPESLDISNIPEGLIVLEFIDNLNRSYIQRAIRKD